MLKTSSPLFPLNRDLKCNTLFYIHHNKMVYPKEKKCTLKDMASSMIQSKGLILHFWVESIN